MPRILVGIIRPAPRYMLNFKYRYVPFGSRFGELRDGLRSCAGSADQPVAALFRNEVVTDVGSVCWGFHGETRPIFDHHFVRAGQFPSAAAAVLHNARRLAELRDNLLSAHGNGAGSGAPLDFWLATHRSPDFDALCSLYLARGVLSGEIPADGWEDYGLHPDGWLPFPQNRPRKINWFEPFVTGLPPERRWPILLAGYAACVDNCRRLACPKNRSLHSILYAALWRGRDYLRESDSPTASGDDSAPRLAGGREFFAEARARLSDLHSPLNPWFDSTLEQSSVFAPELALLDRELQAYDRDIRRARKTIVFVQQAAQEFDSWYTQVQRMPLLGENGRLRPAANSVHLHPPAGDVDHQAYRQVDGLYLRDPECLLFKEWARSDTEHSTLGQGFLFTAIAYSGERDSPGNHSNYFFSLDPEIAQTQHLHLYNVWAQLQTSEVTAIERQPAAAIAEKKRCREGYEGRAAGHPESFSDPWFDGSNYGSTIVATPNGGSLLRDGSASDLSDDAVAAVVQSELEHSIFEPVAHIEEFSYKPLHHDLPTVEHPLFDAEPLPLRENYWRFGHIRLRRDVDLSAGPMVEQIGRVLWRQLEPQSGNIVPRDFQERHLLRGPDWIGVWSREGIVMAWLPGSPQRVTQFLEPLRKLAALSRAIEDYCRPLQANEKSLPEERLKIGEELSRDLADFRRKLSFQNHRLLNRFFDALNMDSDFAAVHEIHRSIADREMNRKQIEISNKIEQALKSSSEIQAKIHWLEILIVATYVVEFLGILHDSFPARVKEDGTMASSTLVLIMSLTAAIVAWRFLRPGAHGHEASPGGHSSPESAQAQSAGRRVVLVMLLLPILFYALFALGVVRKIWPPRHDEEEPPKNHSPPAAAATDHPSSANVQSVGTKSQE